MPENRMKWLVTLKRQNSLADMNNGAKGIFTLKTVIVQCDRKDIEKTIIGYDDFKIDSIQDWDLLQGMQLAQTIQWMFGNA